MKDGSLRDSTLQTGPDPTGWGPSFPGPGKYGVVCIADAASHSAYLASMSMFRLSYWHLTNNTALDIRKGRRNKP